MKLVKIMCALAIAVTASTSMAAGNVACAAQSSAKMFDSTAVKQVAAAKVKPAATSGSAVRSGAN